MVKTTTIANQVTLKKIPNKLSSNNEDELNEEIICDNDSEDICISILISFYLRPCSALSSMSVNLISLNTNHLVACYVGKF